MNFTEELKDFGYPNIPVAEELLQQTMVLKWFRDKHNLHATIVQEEKMGWKTILWQVNYLETIKERFLTYEDAQTAAINKFIEILKTKSK